MKHILLSLVLVLTFSFSAFAAECVSGDCVNGYGTYISTIGEFAGDKYVGEFKDGRRHGQGTYTFANGTTERGIWKNNELETAN